MNLIAKPYTHPMYMRRSPLHKTYNPGIMDKQNWAEAHQEIEQLCRLHDEAIANAEKCREFA
jgi:uncharacterized protein YqgQ